MAVENNKFYFTDRALKALKPAPAGQRYVVWDTGMQHLGVRVTDRLYPDPDQKMRPHRSFVVVKRRPGQVGADTRHLGRYPEITLEQARAKAPGILAEIAAGKTRDEAEEDRRREDDRRRLDEAQRRKDTFTTAALEFIEHEESRGLRSRRETAAILRREFLGQVPKRVKRTIDRDGQKVDEMVTEWFDGPEPVWRNRPIIEIKRRDVIARLNEIGRTSGKHAARHALGAVRKLFNWAEEGERFGIEESSAARIRDRTIGVSGRDLRRQRVLNDAEIRDVWRAADTTGYPFGRLVQLLMLTGQRLNDIAKARRSEIDLDAGTLTVPPERYKTNVAQEVPLSPKAVDILETLPKFKSGYVFTTTSGARPISGLSKMKARLDEAIAEQRVKDGDEPMPRWVLHDLRRTLRTRLTSDLDVDAFVAERVLGHALPGLHGVYDQGAHRTQKRAALVGWEARLLELVEPKPSAPNVVGTEEVAARRMQKRA